MRGLLGPGDAVWSGRTPPTARAGGGRVVTGVRVEIDWQHELADQAPIPTYGGRMGWRRSAPTACTGPAVPEGPFADHPMAALGLHINREVIHHGAEVACLRDLYRARFHDG
jgi:hypothetical protein